MLSNSSFNGNDKHEQIQKDIEALITKIKSEGTPIQAGKFLLATPYDQDPYIHFDKRVTEELFYSEFFTESDIVRDIYNEFHNPLYASRQMALILGYKGCGKSTLSRYLIYGKHNLIIDFEKYVADKSLRENLIGIICEFIDTDFVENKRKVLKKFTEIFVRSEHNRRIMNRGVNAVSRAFSELLDFLGNAAESDAQPSSDYYRDMQEHFNNVETMYLFAFLVYWDMADKTFHQIATEKTYVLFDNLDVVDSNEELSEFMKQFAYFFNNTIRGLAGKFVWNEWQHNEIEASGSPVYWKRYVFVFSMRETTHSKISEHLNDRAFGSRFVYDISTIYQRNEFVVRRKEFLAQHPEIGDSSLMTTIDRIDELMLDYYFRSNILPMFNNDYRTIVHTLTHAYSGWDQLGAAMELLKYGRDDENQKDSYSHVRYGGRAALYRKLFDIFKDEGYLPRIQSQRVSVRSNGDFEKKTVNVARLLLTYLRSYADDYRVDEYKLETFGVSMLDIFNDFEDFVSLEHVTNALWDMFLYKDVAYWNHLVTFDDLAIMSKAELDRLRQDYIDKKRTHASQFPLVRITCAGRVALQDLFVRFEFFAAKTKGDLNASDDLPLFLCGNRKIATIDDRSGRTKEEYVFSSIINRVYREVRGTAERFNDFYADVLQHATGLDVENFVISRYTHTNRPRLGLLRTYEGAHHGVLFSEQAVFSSVGYIESFRQYMLSNETWRDEWTEINKSLVTSIKKYLQLIGQGRIRGDGKAVVQRSPLSASAMTVKKTLLEKINIIEKSSYSDRKTKIDRF